MGRVQLHVRAVVLLATSRVLLRRRGVTDTLRVLTRKARADGVQRQAALRAVRRAGRVAGGKCLAQSVALAALLEHGEQHPTVVLGCRPEGDTWSAHAWVTVGDEVLEPVRGGAHAELARLQAATGWVPTRPENVR